MERNQHKIKWEPNPKQRRALEYLIDNQTTELLFGGAAGGGKSYLGCAWLIINCLRYPDSAWLIGRAVLKDLKQTTLITFFEVAKDWGLKANQHFTYHAQDATIHWFNGSVIYLKDLANYPSDPEFESLGSMALTGAFIDECSQVSVKAKNIIISRIRHRLDEFNLTPKLLLCSNPTKNFLYYDFYKPWKAKELLPHRQYVPALVGDNPHISQSYIENLRRLDKITQERLLYGNWEYDADPSKLMEYDKITDIFINTPPASDKRYLSCDVARFGGDKVEIIYWEGLLAKEIHEHSKQSTITTEQQLLALAQEKQIPRSNIVVDDDGVGGGVVDHMPGVRAFVNGSKARNSENYSNLKSQCYYTLAQYVNEGKIGVRTNNEQIKARLIEDLEQVKRKDPDKDDTRLAVVSKDEVKEKLGRSPDVGDALMFRMLFELEKGEWGISTRGL